MAKVEHKMPDLEGIEQEPTGVVTTEEPIEKGGDAGGEEKGKGKEQEAVQDVTASKPAKVADASAAEAVMAAPNTWGGEAKAEWAKLPKAVQEVVAKREKEIHEGIAQYKGKAEIGAQFEQVVTPYIPVLRAMGQEPMQAIGNLLQYQYLMRTDPYNTLYRLAQEYRVDIGQLARLAGVQSQEGQQPMDPAIRQVFLQNQQLQAHLAQTEQQRRMQLEQEADMALQQFGSDPKHEFYADPQVRQVMGGLMNQKIAGDLQTAYDKAVLLVPHIKAQLDERQTASIVAERGKTLKQKAADAKRASVDVVNDEGSNPFAKDDSFDSLTDLQRRYRAMST